MNKNNEYMKNYMRNRWHSRRKKAIEFFGGSCRSCGTIFDLEFDHIKREDKTYTIAKISLLCRKCHLKKSIVEGAFKKTVVIKHGTVWAYSGHKCRCDLCKKAKSDYEKGKSKART